MIKANKSERDWTEDFHLENGNYENECCHCNNLFIGHKRRVSCKKCSSKPEKSEYILCSAIWYKELTLVKNEIPKDLLLPKNLDCGICFCGYRHPHCLYQMVAITGKAQHEAGEEVQGFLTSENRFVDREEGAQIHIANGGKLNYSSKQLYSEDLY